MIGGLGSIAGPIVGAAYNGFFVLFTNPVWVLVATGVGVLLLLLLSPAGLVSVFYWMRDSMLRRVAIRQRIVVPSLLADLREGSLDARADIAPGRVGAEQPRSPFEFDSPVTKTSG